MSNAVLSRHGRAARRTQPGARRTRHVRPVVKPTRVVRKAPRGPDRSIVIASSAGSAEASVGIRFRIDVVLPVLVFLISLLSNLGAISETPFHPDESRWLNRAHFVRDLADPFGSTWDDYYTTRGQPPLGSYLMGVGLLLQGRDLDTNLIWDFSYDAEWNEAFGAMADDADLLAGRRTNAVVSALTVVAVYFLGRMLTNRIGGLIGAIFLALHPLSIYLATQALSDQLLALLLALAFIAVFRFMDRPTWFRAIQVGALLGLGGATKLSPLLLSVPLALVGLVWLGWLLLRARQRIHRDMLHSTPVMLILQPLIAFATFVLVSPFLWPDPIRRTYYLFEFRRVEMLGQGRNWPEVAVSDPLEALSRVGRRLDVSNSASLRIQEIIQRQTGFAWEPVSIDLMLVIIGGILLLRLLVRQGFLSPIGLTCLVIGAETAAVIGGMGSDFYRYYMPVVLVSAILVGVAAGEILQPPRTRWLLRQAARIPGIDLVNDGRPAQQTRPTPSLTQRFAGRITGVQSPR